MFAENSYTLMFTTTEFILRIAVAGVLGAAVGLERELRAKEAGTRTHFLVSMGSALFTILSQYGFNESLKLYESFASFDPSRIAAQVVTGIGFIGAHHNISEARCKGTNHGCRSLGYCRHRHDRRHRTLCPRHWQHSACVVLS